MQTLKSKLNGALCKFANCDALYVNKQTLSYAQLNNMSHYVAQLLDNSDVKSNRVAILAHRELVAYTTIIACILTAKTYVPLNIKAPIERLVSMINTAKINTLVVSEKYQNIANDIKMLLPDIEIVLIAEAALYQKSQEELKCFNKWQSLTNSICYIMFTSGSTGKPKGVPISEDNLISYLDFVIPFCGLSIGDRTSQTFDLTFDLSVHDLFVTWLSGACLFVLPESALFSPGAFIKKHRLTAWFSVPSTGAIMQKFGMLKENMYPSLKLSLFCGEALPTNMAIAWQKSACNSKVVNFYGPTEATIACAYFKIPDDYSEEEIIPIGKAFPHMSFSLSDNEELLISGTQVTAGYLESTPEMKENFEQVSSQDENIITWYHSGDKVAWHEGGYYIYKGRLDEQVKIQGYRVELQEIEILAKNYAKNNLIKAIVWPRDINSFNKAIYLFIQTNKKEKFSEELVEFLNKRLPHYMQPRKIILLENMPLNLNGKIDSNALRATLE
ncbi:AMP-binding protein [Colwellia sp. 1_MG-2023]|uniref:AMP-binding protein n=1 Tax=Colwellia sp. 1_MG-2023 TaxID=3062649 RepID=UPI0026E27493|nr:AMP-binding protein [Colwellia sp. 1_MG-2023]MDO6444393.1 AMP-binding protein [Colwellia sp. 1_MG-2023]